MALGSEGEGGEGDEGRGSRRGCVPRYVFFFFHFYYFSNAYLQIYYATLMAITITTHINPDYDDGHR
jgi:hypothetical protein